MKQTAVEWLVNEILMPEYGNIPEWVIDKVNEAKAMEKEQILEALRTSEVELLSWGISAEQYYKETFKSE